ncbi:MAG TPA: DUF350 domain-containing protein [Spirochaetota bacterium]|nr:DUF350 domain-containing protein [Spirochaetota bacterium]HNT10520.1 DUF350 domain-containing protein [Spirochaetota bacterium]HNV49060.1 DUF350 domain-containing protein [Spirochaetota bacterium]HOS41309.1 DUF350 domain-containing protein [Spirochaetota bacterium]HPU88409.1 DUF350 domain-containing protein [Spirochaetota bacterium]
MDWGSVGIGIIETVIYSLVGIAVMGIGFLLFKLICPFSIKKEIEDDQNTSLGIIIGSIIIGLSIIVASVISTPTSSKTRPVKADAPVATDIEAKK